MDILEHVKRSNMIYTPMPCAEDVYRFLLVIMSMKYSSTAVTYSTDEEGKIPYSILYFQLRSTRTNYKLISINASIIKPINTFLYI